MSRNAAKPSALDTDRYITAAISLLNALTAATQSRVDAATFREALSLTDAQLNEIVYLLQVVGDENTGARIAIRRENDDIVLEGDAGLFNAVRFTSDEALAIMQVLDRFCIEDGTREHIAAALAPSVDQTDRVLLAGDPLFGGFYQELCEAMVIGARLTIAYRSADERTSSERIVDPGFITVSGDAAYLVAWNVEKDAQRLYRLDRIERVTLTEDSVGPHPFERESVEENLRAEGSVATLRFAERNRYEWCTWSGLDRATAKTLEDGSTLVQVFCVSEPWLFDQVLAAGGTLEIVGPQELRNRFVAYATEILGK